MTKPNEILGYVLCRTCNAPKAIKQGRGKRSAFVHGRCGCGPDTRTGVAAQAEMNAYKSLEEIQAEIDAQNQPNQPEPEPETKPIQTKSETESEPKPETVSEGVSATGCVGIGALLGLLVGGTVKLIKAVA